MVSNTKKTEKNHKHKYKTNKNTNTKCFFKLSEASLVFQDYELVRKREVKDIVNFVEEILKEGEIVRKKKKEKEEKKSLRDEL